MTERTLLYRPGDAYARMVAESLRVAHNRQTQEFEGPAAPHGTDAILTIPATGKGSCLHNPPPGNAGDARSGGTTSLPSIRIVERGRNVDRVPVPEWARMCDRVYAIELNVQNICNLFAEQIATDTVPTLHMA